MLEHAIELRARRTCLAAKLIGPKRGRAEVPANCLPHPFHERELDLVRRGGHLVGSRGQANAQHGWHLPDSREDTRMINRTAAHVSRRATHAGREARRPCDEEVADVPYRMFGSEARRLPGFRLHVERRLKPFGPNPALVKYRKWSRWERRGVHGSVFILSSAAQAVPERASPLVPTATWRTWWEARIGCRPYIARADAELAPERPAEGGRIRKAQHLRDPPDRQVIPRVAQDREAFRQAPALNAVNHAALALQQPVELRTRRGCFAAQFRRPERRRAQVPADGLPNSSSA